MPVHARLLHFITGFYSKLIPHIDESQKNKKVGGNEVNGRMLALEKIRREGEMKAFLAALHIHIAASEEAAQLFDVLALYKRDGEEMSVLELCERIKEEALINVSYALHYTLPCSYSFTAPLSGSTT